MIIMYLFSRVIATKNDEYPVGSQLVGYWGW
jgi:hypothetical protein